MNTTRKMKRTNKSENSSAHADRQSLRSALRWLIIPLSAVLTAILINTCLIISAIVPSESMADTVERGSLIIALRTAYRGESPSRGDIVIFSHPEIDERYVMKRVIGLPGETVEIRHGRVYIDGAAEPLEEPYVGKFSDESIAAVTVPEGKYYLLGDNRCHSYDARFWSDPFVGEDSIYGKVVFRLFPKSGSVAR